MNRTLLLGIALFLAVVGLALFGGSNPSLAGHGCCGCHGYHGCYGCYGCHGGGCHGNGCNGYGCNGYGHDCNGYGCAGNGHGCAGGYGGGVIVEGTPIEIPPGNGPPLEGDGPPPEGGDPPPPPEKSKGDVKKEKGEARRGTTTLVLHVPEDAKVILSGRQTRSTGAVRRYATARLPMGHTISNYSVRVEVQRDGVAVVKQQNILLRSGRIHELTVEITPTDVAAARARATR